VAEHTCVPVRLALQFVHTPVHYPSEDQRPCWQGYQRGRLYTP
jgi:hypothetical protein